jgi:hypothetical protein
MPKPNDLALITELLENAEKNIKMAKQLLLGDTAPVFFKKEINIPSSLKATSEGNARIIEGVFDGQSMRGADGKTYPVIANYASKSKLIEGDHLKLTILEDGTFIFKQIGPADRKSLVGILTYDDGKYKVLSGGKAYNVLHASVTYYKAQPGDEVTVLTNALEETSNWAAIDNIITPVAGKENNILSFDIEPKKKKKDKKESDDILDSDLDYKID